MHHHRSAFARAALLALLALLGSALAAAQVDPRARALIEGLEVGERADVRTLEQTMVMTVFIEDTEQVVRTRSVIDYERRLAAIDTEVAPGMSMRIVVTDGQARMVMGGMQLPVPPELAGDFAALFDGGGALLGEGVIATYDGVQSYGGLVEGEQVTVRNAAALPGLDGAEETRLLFDASGALIAVVGVVPDVGIMVSVLDEPMRGSPVVASDATIYLLEDGRAPVRYMTMRVEDVRVNQPIPDGTFD